MAELVPTLGIAANVLARALHQLPSSSSTNKTVTILTYYETKIVELTSFVKTEAKSEACSKIEHR